MGMVVVDTGPLMIWLMKVNF